MADSLLNPATQAGAQPQTPPPAALGTSDVTAGGITMPQWSAQLSGNFANDINSALTNAGGLSQAWYNQPVAAGVNSLETQAGNAAATPYNWQTGFQQAQGGLNQYQTQFDPTQLNKFMNPYTSSVDQNIATLGARNLSENLLPAVNSTFTGAGQFGSTRNADFNNRAVRDTNQSILQQQAQNDTSQFNNAMQQYQSWNANPLNFAQAQSGLSTAGSNNAWGDITKQLGTGTTLQQNTQAGLTANYQDWLNSIQIPQNLMGGLANMLPAVQQMYTKMPVSQAQSLVPLTSPTGVGGLGQVAQAASGLFSGTS
jgi:hypothetical protein